MWESISESQLRRGLNAGSVVCGVAALGLIARSWLTVVPIDPLKPPPRVLTTPPKSANSLRLADLESAWNRSLQGGFVPADAAPSPTRPPDMIAAPAPMPPSPSETLGIRLVGTILESGHNLAIATDRQGRVAYQTEGETFALSPEGILISEIQRDEVRVSYRGQTMTLRIGATVNLSREDANTADSFSPPDAFASPPPMSVDDELDFLNGT